MREPERILKYGCPDTFMTARTPNQILKSVTALGSSQGVMILCSLVRAKLVAVILGPSATGLFAVFNNAVDTVGSLTRLDLRRATVREISRVKTTSQAGMISTAVLKTAWILGVVGGLVMALLSPVLSKISFGSSDYTSAFATLGIALVALSLQEGYYSIMTGRGYVRRFVISQMAGSICGLVVSVPLFFWLGLGSIVPSIIVYAVASAVVAAVMTGKTDSEKRSITAGEALRMIYPALKLGMWLTLAAFMTRGADYIFVSWMTNGWSVETVGVYNAGATLIGRTAALLLAALASEYYPRISSLGLNDNGEMNSHVGSQARVLLWVAVPLLVLFVILDRFVVEILYSDEYMSVVPYFAGAAAAVPLKIASWSLAFVILARGDGKLYLMTETISSLVSLVVNMTAFKTGGMEWLGYACLINEGLYFAIVSFACRRYGVGLSGRLTATVICGAVIVLLSGIISL